MFNFVVLSYPRSGSVLMCEYMVALGKENARKLKTHMSRLINNKPVVMVLRNYKECIVRQLRKSGESQKRGAEINSKNFLESLEGTNGRFGYIPVLKVFDKCPCKKTLIYYEDMITDGYSTI